MKIQGPSRVVADERPSRAPRDRVKVARIIARLNVGGPAIQVCFLHQALRPQFDTVLITGQLDEGEGDMSYLLSSSDGVDHLDSLRRPVGLWSDLVSVFRMIRILRRERPDIVHTHTAKAGTVGRLAALFSRIPVIVHTYHGHIFRGDYFGPWKTRTFLTIERILARWTDKLVTVSDSQARELAEDFRIAPRNKFEVIHNGYDLRPFLSGAERTRLREEWGIGGDQSLVVWAGRLVPVKNVELLAAVVREARQHATLKFVVVGDGSERTKLLGLLAGYDNVRLVGWRSDMPAVWAAADIALLTSKNEGTPSALIEAMASARPFVATAVGGVQDMIVGTGRTLGPGVQEFDNGLFVEADPSAMLRALLRLASSRDDGGLMGNAGRDFVLRRYSQDRLAREMADLYSQLTGRMADVASN